MSDSGYIKSNCPACLEPGTMWLITTDAPSAHISCVHCGFCLTVPPGPNPAREVALEHDIPSEEP